MAEDFGAAWRALISARASAKVEVDPTHPLRLLYGVDDYGRALFFAISSRKPPVPEVSQDVAVSLGHRADGRWTLVLTLLDSSLFEVFAKLCNDLVDRSRTDGDENQALEALLAALSQWKELLRPARPDHLSMEALRGLMGELWFGFIHLGAFIAPEAVLAAWKGPLGGPQDFEFTTGHSFEVKAVHTNAAAVRISSAQQLDALHRHLRLAVVTLDTCDVSATGAVTLPVLVDKIRASLHAGADGRPLFDRILRDYPVDPNDPYYADMAFRAVTHQEFAVSDKFPAIRASTLDAGIRDVRYRLDLNTIAPFEVAPTTHLPNTDGVSA